MNLGRREFLAGAVALGGSMALCRPALARPADAQLLEIAQRELARAGNKVWLRDTVGLADFSMPSYEQRFFLIDMVAGKVRTYYVSHGFGSDPTHSGWLRSFSNVPESKATSRGSFITHTWYEGQNGTSMRLAGVDHDNSNAEARAIVIHGAAYANPDMISVWGKLGRSSGCFVFPQANLMEVLARLGPGRLLFSDRLQGDIAPPLLPPEPIAPAPTPLPTPQAPTLPLQAPVSLPEG